MCWKELLKFTLSWTLLLLLLLRTWKVSIRKLNSLLTYSALAAAVAWSIITVLKVTSENWLHECMKSFFSLSSLSYLHKTNFAFTFQRLNEFAVTSLIRKTNELRRGYKIVHRKTFSLQQQKWLFLFANMKQIWQRRLILKLSISLSLSLCVLRRIKNNFLYGS